MRKRLAITLIAITSIWIPTILAHPAIAQRQRGSKPSVAMPGHWYIFTSPDGDFRLAFPFKPKLEEVSEGPVTLIREFGATTNNGIRFSVNLQDMGGDPREPGNNEWGRELEEMSSAADRKQGIEVAQTHRLAKNIVETEVWQTVSANGAHINYLRRSILRRGRVYILACGWVMNGRPVDKPICQRFFDSMRFINKPDQRPQPRS